MNVRTMWRVGSLVEPDASPSPPGRGFHPLRVMDVARETADAVSLVLEVPDPVRELFAYRPGQFVTVQAQVAGESHFRSYSMSSAPELDDDLTITVKAVPGGIVSSWLTSGVVAGDTLQVSPP